MCCWCGLEDNVLHQDGILICTCATMFDGFFWNTISTSTDELATTGCSFFWVHDNGSMYGIFPYTSKYLLRRCFRFWGPNALLGVWMSMDTWILEVIPDSYDISGSLGKNYFINLDFFETNSFHVWVYLPAFTIKINHPCGWIYHHFFHLYILTNLPFCWGIPSLPRMLLEKWAPVWGWKYPSETNEQWKKPWLFRLYRGLYYPILWGFWKANIRMKQLV